MRVAIIAFIFVLILISSCNIQKEVPKEKITGKTVSEPKEEVKVVKNETLVGNNTKIEDNETLILEEYQARSNILSTENKIKEIYELLIDLEDKNRINRDEMIDAQKRLDKIRDNFNLSYNFYNNKEYIKAKETAIQVKKDAKEIIRTL